MMRCLAALCTLLAPLLVAVPPAAARLAVQVGSSVGVPGGAAAIEVSLATDRDDVAGVGNTISVEAPLHLRSCSGNPAIGQNVFFSFLPSGCQEKGVCLSVRAIAIAFVVVPPLRDGEIVYRCDVGIDAAAAAGSRPLRCSEAEGGDFEAGEIEAECVDGGIDVVVPTATPTPTPTRAAASPSATLSAGDCLGDCDGDLQVEVHELVTAVGIALEETAVDRCAAADGDGDRQVAIAELVRGIANALRGC